MSSVVNKSSKRFMPKVASRGPAPKGPGRRLSMLRTSFSVPNPSHDRASGKPATNERPTLELTGEVPDEAIDTDEPSLAPSSVASQPTPSITTSKSHSDVNTDSTSSEKAPTPTPTPTPTPIPTEKEPDSQIGTQIAEPTNQAVPIATRPPELKRPARVIPPSAKRLATASSSASVARSSAASDAVPKPSMPRPRSAPLASTGSSQPHAPAASAYVAPRSAPQSDFQKPPEGCEFVDLDSLPQLKMNERRRRIAFEREFVTIMRELFFEREKLRLAEVSDLSDEYIEIEARSNAENATYHKLKQAVGQEAKVIRDKRHEENAVKTGSNDTSNNFSSNNNEPPVPPALSAAATPPVKPVINEQRTTMATLCKDLPFGEANAAFDDYELARVNRRRDTMRVLKAKMWSRGQYQPKDGEKLQLQEAYRKYQDERKDRTGKIKVEQSKKFNEIDIEADSSNSGSLPQASIEIQANGAISLVGTQYDRHQNNRSQVEGGTQGPKTEVDPTEQVINSFSFSTKERPDRWTKEETEKFYEAVSALGTDFNLISHLFPTRSRNQIKTKFKYEERRNPAKLHIHMVSRRKFSLESYSKVSNVDIVEVNSIESELEKIRKEHQEQMKLEETARQEAKAEDRQPIRKPKKEKV